MMRITKHEEAEFVLSNIITELHLEISLPNNETILDVGLSKPKTLPHC